MMLLMMLLTTTTAWPQGYVMVKITGSGTEFVLTEKHGIKSNDFRKIKTVIDENADIIIKRWNEHFNK